MKTEPNDNAYPIVETKGTESLELGLTKRELFAAMAMQGLLPLMFGSTYAPSGVVKDAVKFADDLINELNKKEDENKDT